MWSEPRPQAFLAAEAGIPGRLDKPADVVVCGMPFDGSVSFRGGAAGAPAGIRWFSDSIETYSPRCGRDLEDLRLADAGDAPRADDATAGAFLDEIWTAKRRPLLVTLGGDHAITPPMVRCVAQRVPGLAVVGFDAHLDLRRYYHGEHACASRRMVDAGLDVHLFGVRSGQRAEWDDAAHVLAHFSPQVAVPESVLDALRSRPVYVTVDIDVLDPSEAPGTGTPEAGGASYADLLDALESLHGSNVVAVDVVEVAPVLDPSGITQAAAAKLVREMVLRYCAIP